MAIFHSTLRNVRKVIRILVGRFFRYSFLKSIVNVIQKVPQAKLHSVSLSDLDSILERAPNLQAFLENKNLVSQYYSGLSEYFGARRFPRRSFDAILDQLKIVKDQVPGFSERVWEKHGDKSHGFNMVVTGSSTGRDLNLSLWKLYRFDWLSQMKKNYEKRFSDVPHTEIFAEARKYFGRVESKIDHFEMGLRQSRYHGRGMGINQREERMLRAEFYKKIRNEESMLVFASFFVYQFMTSYENRFFFQLSDADLIIDYLNHLKQNPRQFFSCLTGVVIPSPLLTEAKNQVPSGTTLLEDKSLFPEIRVGLKAGKTARAVFHTELIRPFHGLWLGIAGNDCLAGDPTSLDQLTPARWAVSVLEGSRTVVIEKDGRYQGFARCVPLRNDRNEVYGSLELWASVFNNRFIFLHEDTHSKESIPFFDAWFPKFLQILPKHWSGVVASESKFIDNIGVKNSILASARWKYGMDLCDSSELFHVDVLALDISRVVEPKGRALLYCSEMVFDAKISDAGRVRALSIRDLSRV